MTRAPGGPGCYLWKNASDEVLYIGKAIRLRSRLKSYLNPDQLKTKFLMKRVFDLEWITTATGADALVLEANLIKKYKPRYNVRLKDDKRYPYICVSTSEPYPQVYITRKILKNGDRYFGPFTDVRATRNTLTLIHKIFPIRKKPLKLPLRKPVRPCMNFHIKRCLAPCQGDVPAEEYAKLVDEIILFMEGKREILEGRIRERMRDYSNKNEYEKAAIYRDMLYNIRQSSERKSGIDPHSGDEDIIAYAGLEDNGQIVLLEIRDGQLLGRKSFPLIGTRNSTEPEILSAFLRDYYISADFIPSRIIARVLPVDCREILSFLRKKTKQSIQIKAATRLRVREMILTAQKNAELLLKERLLAVKIDDRRQALKEIENFCELDAPPTLIECYDISHIQGFLPVGSQVMFIDGAPHRAGYRRYKIKYTPGINDPAMIKEVLIRRIQALLNNEETLPDLLLIDGGRAQLTAACEALAALNTTTLPVIALAKKREEIYIPGRALPLVLDPESSGMKLLRRIRDEAHRFAISYHRERRNRNTVHHLIETIEDIGMVRKKALLKHFSDKKIEMATEAELLEVPGIGPGLAKKIKNFLTTGESAAETSFDG